MSQTFTSVDDQVLQEIVAQARQRLVVVAPGIRPPLGRRSQPLGPSRPMGFLPCRNPQNLSTELAKLAANHKRHPSETPV